MSKKWYFSQESCILLEQKREVLDNEWEGEAERGQSWSSKTYALPNTHCSLCSLLWKRIVFLGVLSSLLYLFPLLGAAPWPPPKCLLQMFIFINVAYTRQESFTKALWHSAPEITSAWGCPGQSALILRPPIPTSKQKPLQFLFTLRRSIESQSQSLLSWKASHGLWHSSSPLTKTLSCLI